LEVTAAKDSAAELNSADNPSQAPAAESIGPEPAPESINKEVISGGAVRMLIAVLPLGRETTSAKAGRTAPALHC